MVSRAVRAWQSKPYDILLFDIAMPNKTGDQALAAIRKLEKLDNRPPALAIAITANKLELQLNSLFQSRFQRLYCQAFIP